LLISLPPAFPAVRTSPSSLFLFTAPSSTLLHPLSLHDALPISPPPGGCAAGRRPPCGSLPPALHVARTSSDRPWRRTAARCRFPDRKSTRLNSSHVSISYAVFCLKKKNRMSVSSFILTKT